MANYQELIIKAISSLTENNGAARREVYEKARKALVTQLQAVEPSLAPREITQHRLELEDCIRHVEQEATEKILGGLQKLDDTHAPNVVAPESLEAIVLNTAAAQPAPAVPVPFAPVAAPIPAAPPAQPPALDTSSIDAIIARAEVAPTPERVTSGIADAILAELTPAPVAPVPVAPVAPVPVAAPPPAVPVASAPVAIPVVPTAPLVPVPTPIPAAPVAPPRVAAPIPVVPIVPVPVAAIPVALAVVPAGVAASQAVHAPIAAPVVASIPAPVIPPTPLAAPPRAAVPPAASPAYSTSVSDAAVGVAMSRVREVEVEVPQQIRAITTDNPVPAFTPSTVEGPPVEPSDAQLVVDRALEALNREAITASEEDVVATANAPAIGDDFGAGDNLSGASDAGYDDDLVPDDNFLPGSVDEERGGGGGALTIFLILAIVLLGAVGGGGYWAWREGYVDLDALFAQTEPVVTIDAADALIANGGPGNTTTSTNEVEPAEQLASLDGEIKLDERLPQGNETTDTGSATNQIASPTGDENKVEDRLGAADSSDSSLVASSDTAVTLSGAQSLLLEATPGGTTGAVPFSGTVEWERGADELGQPTLIGRANIPARALSVEVLIRRNGDPTLPASHLVEIQFETSETFVGGSIASFGGILLKNEELVPGTSLIGAPARVFENMFLFALNSEAQDLRTNVGLLENNKWMDLALVYATGRQAIITLEKDAAAEAMFSEVIAIWSAADQ